MASVIKLKQKSHTSSQIEELDRIGKGLVFSFGKKRKNLKNIFQPLVVLLLHGYFVFSCFSDFETLTFLFIILGF